MEGTELVPDGEIILGPPESNLQVVVLRDQLQEVILEDLALALRDAVDPPGRDLVRRAEETLPAGDGVGSDDRTRTARISNHDASLVEPNAGERHIRRGDRTYCSASKSSP